MKRLSLKKTDCTNASLRNLTRVNFTKQALQMVIDVIKYAFKNTDKTEQLRSSP